MFTISAFADEIDPDPEKQIDVLKQCGVRHIEFRSILKTNVLALTDLQIQEFKSLLQKHGFKYTARRAPTFARSRTNLGARWAAAPILLCCDACVRAISR